ncbi:hypothetical protein SAMN05444506_103188 [Pseudomonas syringae]|uniref:Uncharacterized protein n=1 Tax=Pseudomonas syringae pv. apii TaxID=81036 RepID=A0A3M3MGA6_9PSED|nr:hypothetical protein ALQ91_200111 [Pseudomonas syringae pv. syringae]RMN46547.1 hypothetical protein ALQ58_200235 [Pseudomonas syringae pv. apii]RMN53094.1 hypothetical protein ALQ59_03457 [Pseudomonas syringae pv. apii]RMO01428.1 hypothetical protein ALQ49_00767 [Pseudomonas syringae pv. apii]SDY46809.1 hypothetical protein SAMN05444506_103188 [Pseudomonas syringae]
MITFGLLKVIAYSLSLYAVGVTAFAIYQHKQQGKSE